MSNSVTLPGDIFGNLLLLVLSASRRPRRLLLTPCAIWPTAWKHPQNRKRITHCIVWEGRSRSYSHTLTCTENSLKYACVVFNVRRCASAVYAMALCLSMSVRLPQVGVIYRNGWTHRAGFWHGSFLITLSYKKIPVTVKIRVLPSGNLPRKTVDLKNFAMTSRCHCQQYSPLLSSTVDLDDTYTTVDESWLFTASQSTVTF